MKKTIVVVLLLLSVIEFGFSTRQGILQGIMKPEMVEVSGNRIYVIEGAQVFIYSLDDLSLVTRFGKKGEGPGEVKVVPFLSNWIKVLPDSILINSFDKLLYFSKEGRLIKELKKSPLVTLVTPVGENYVAKASKVKDKIQYVAVNLYDSKMQKIKEFYCQEFIQQGNKIQMIADFINFQVFDDKIFIEESLKGFLIGVFDSSGNRIYEVRREYEKIPVKSEDKEAAYAEFREDPSVKPQIKTSGGWETFRKFLQFNFPDYFPPIQEFNISDGKMYIKTYTVREGREEYLVLDLKGKLLKRVYLPVVKRPSLWDYIKGIRLYQIENDTLYYLVEDEDEEVWELHVEKIKI